MQTSANPQITANILNWPLEKLVAEFLSISFVEITSF